MKGSDPLRRRVHLRLTLLGLASSLSAGVLAGRLVFLQILSRDSLRERAQLQQQDTMKLDPTRGAIFDRQGRVLALSVDVESVYARPGQIRDLKSTAARLASCLRLDPAELRGRLQTDKRFVWVKRKVDPAAADCVRRLEIPGVEFLPESRRFYPKRTVAAHVLGYVGMDNEGMSGIEYAFEPEIRGEPGRQIILTDARKRRAASRVERRPQPGHSLYLTLDQTLQHVSQAELELAVEESHSKSGVAVLMRPETGELLAMAVVPTFNPNRYGASPPEHWRNRAVTDAYEPGSTFKIVTAAAALEEGVVSEEERIDCGRGSIEVGDRLIKDHRVFDVLRFGEVIEESSNVGIIRIGQRLGRDRLSGYVRAFGFGEATGAGLPGESRGILREASRWGPVTLASISMGQEVAVTPLQMVTAVNAIAASGYVMRPLLLREVRSPTGKLIKSFSPEPVRRVVSAETARRLTDLLVGAVERGTGKRAAIPGYAVAGKTGTAQKPAPGGGYSETEFIASFVGFVPATRPELTGIVILDSPAGEHSGARAASVFARLMERSLRYLGVPPERRELRVRVASRWPEQAPLHFEDSARQADGGARSDSLAVARVAFREGQIFGGEGILIPALYGLPARDAVARLVACRLVPELVGSGRVMDQLPAPGSTAEPGSRCILILGEGRAQEPGMNGERFEKEAGAEGQPRWAQAVNHGTGK